MLGMNSGRNGTLAMLSGGGPYCCILAFHDMRDRWVYRA